MAVITQVIPGALGHPRIGSSIVHLDDEALLIHVTTAGKGGLWFAHHAAQIIDRRHQRFGTVDYGRCASLVSRVEQGSGFEDGTVCTLARRLGLGTIPATVGVVLAARLCAPRPHVLIGSEYRLEAPGQTLHLGHDTGFKPLPADAVIRGAEDRCLPEARR